MSDLKKQLIRLGYDQPELRQHLKPVLDTITKTSSKEVFRDAALGYVHNHVGELDFHVEQELMAQLDRVNKGRSVEDPMSLLQSLMRERQDISGKAGLSIDAIIHSLEDIARP